MNKKRIIIVIVLVAIIGGGWYGYREYTRKVKDLAHVKAEVRIDARTLLSEFEASEAAANSKYLDKIIAVTGMVRTIEKDEKGYYSVVLGERNTMSSVRCSMDSTYQDEVAGIAGGSLLTVKGACTGFNADELLGSDVILNRCVIDK